MALALEHTAEWFRGVYAWKPNECGVQYDAMPPNEAGQFYVAIDDGGVEAGRDETAALQETLTLVIGIWRRPEHLSQKDRRANLKLPIDKYLLGAYTLHDLERMVLIFRASGEPKLNGLHQNFEFMNALNNRYNLPHAELGSKFNLPLFYRGRGRMETVGLDDQGTVNAFYGYRLRFRGLTRVQVTNNANYAIG